MRKGLLGSIAALAAGAGAAWGQPPVEPTTPPPATRAGIPSVMPGTEAPRPPIGGPPAFGGLPSHAIPGNAGFAPPPVVMPPGNYGPAFDPLGLGPVGGFGPPPAPMYPMPGPPGAQAWQPAPPLPNVPDGTRGGRFGGHSLNYGTAPCWWVEGEYLLWFTNGQPAPYPLLTTSAPNQGGVLGAASTTVLVSNRDLGYNAMDGMRIASGFYGDADRRFGFEMSGFFIERASNIQRFGDLSLASGIPTLARPFIDATTGVQSSIVLSGPNFGPARASVGTNTQTWGVEPVALWNVYRSEPGSRLAWSFDVFAGYKFIQLKENLFIESTTALDDRIALPVFFSGPFGVITQLPAVVGTAQAGFGGVLVGGPAVVQIRDSFRATNRFNGMVMGFRTEARYGMVTASSFLKVSLGNMHERVEISGGGLFVDSTGRSGGALPSPLGGFALGVGGGAGATVGGVLANASNIGTFVNDRFTVIPEFGGNLGIALTKRLTGYVGISVIYFPDVVRPGDLVNPVVSSAAIPFSPNFGAPNAPRGPSLGIRETEHWLGGVNFGMRFRY